jgi:hypothetical protein
MDNKAEEKKYLKCPYYEPDREESKRCTLLQRIGGGTGTGPSVNDRTWIGQSCEPDLCTFLASQKDEQNNK